MKEAFASLKPHIPGISAVLSGVFFVATLLFNYSGKAQHVQDVQLDQERRIALLEKDEVTRREIDLLRQEMKENFADVKGQIQSYRDEEYRYHHRP